MVPGATTPGRVQAIEAEGARVEHVDGDYDAAVRRAASLADERHLVIADTSWPGYEEVPRRVVEGYATIFAELDAQLDGRTVDLVVVPIGVGSLAAAAARHFRATPGERPRLVGLEPIDAACVLASARAGHPVTVDGDLSSVMAGLNCPTPSMDAWPQLAGAFDAFCAVGDGHVLDGMRRLAAEGLDRGGVRGRRRRRPHRAAGRSGAPRGAGPARARDRPARPDRGRDRPRSVRRGRRARARAGLSTLTWPVGSSRPGRT